MAYIIETIKQLEDLINNREYVDNLTIDINNDINHLLCNLTNLTYLNFGYDYDQLTDLSQLSNLQYLKFGGYYNQKTDLSTLLNLQHLEFGSDYNQITNLSALSNLTFLEFRENYNQSTDLTQCKKLEKLDNTEIEKLDLSTYRKGIFKKS